MIVCGGGVSLLLTGERKEYSNYHEYLVTENDARIEFKVVSCRGSAILID